jgi:hypothetical protein
MGDVPDSVGGMAAIAHLHWAGDLFDMSHFSTVMLLDLGCLVTDSPTWERLVASGEVQPVEGLSAIQNPRTKGARDRGQELDLIYKALMPSQRMQESMVLCQEKVNAKLGSGPHMTIHMRVEDDWLSQCRPKKIKKRVKHGPLLECTNAFAVAGRTVFNARMIADVVMATPELKNYLGNIFMLYAADRLNRPKAVKQWGKQPSPTKVWPPGTMFAHPLELGCFAETGFSYTERSVVNFFMAALDRGPFVGTARSTFSMGVFLFRRWRSEKSYLYDCKKKKTVVPFAETPALRDPQWIATTRPIAC